MPAHTLGTQENQALQPRILTHLEKYQEEIIRKVHKLVVIHKIFSYTLKKIIISKSFIYESFVYLPIHILLEMKTEKNFNIYPKLS